MKMWSKLIEFGKKGRVRIGGERKFEGGLIKES
jgi:hypothetical protein